MGVEKTCSTCNIRKSISEFYKQKKGLLGRTGECKECRKSRSKLWGQENKEKKSEMNKLWYRSVDRKAYNEKWRKNNPEYFKIYYKQNTEIRLACNKRFWDNHPERKKFFGQYQNAIKNGVLIRPKNCTLCGNTGKIHGHHHDYSKPLNVVWMCSDCHHYVHKKVRIKDNKM